MADWVRYASGQYGFVKDEHPKRVAWVRQSANGWQWIVQDVTGRHLCSGVCRTASKARARAAGVVASEGLSEQHLARLQRERREAGFGEDEWV